MQTSRNLFPLQLLAGITAAAAAYALLPKKPRTRSSQIVLITGGSRGLGYALAERFGRSGARLVLTAREFPSNPTSKSLNTPSATR
jgi:NADPH:quinone reductase-like Zn-dependent oxidoreductase